MREEPIISGAIVKAALVILVGGALGAGAYALVNGGLDDINLPDLPDVNTTTDATVLQDTTLQDTTLGEDAPEQPVAEASTDPFTTAGLDSALGKVRDEAGVGSQLTRLTINDVQTQFIVRKGNGVEALGVMADGGDLQREDASITISGNASIGDFVFSLLDVDPAAIDRMLSAARKQSGASDFRPTVLTLERGIPFGSRTLEWTINAEGGGRNLLYRASADGRGVRNEGGKGSPVPPAIQEARKLNDCIQAAKGDSDQIFACLDRFQ